MASFTATVSGYFMTQMLPFSMFHTILLKKAFGSTFIKIFVEIRQFTISLSFKVKVFLWFRIK